MKQECSVWITHPYPSIFAAAEPPRYFWHFVPWHLWTGIGNIDSTVDKRFVTGLRL